MHCHWALCLLLSHSCGLLQARVTTGHLLPSFQAITSHSHSPCCWLKVRGCAMTHKHSPGVFNLPNSLFNFFQWSEDSLSGEVNDYYVQLRIGQAEGSLKVMFLLPPFLRQCLIYLKAGLRLYLAKDDLELLDLLPPTAPECWDYRRVLSGPVVCVKPALNYPGYIYQPCIVHCYSLLTQNPLHLHKTKLHHMENFCLVFNDNKKPRKLPKSITWGCLQNGSLASLGIWPLLPREAGVLDIQAVCSRRRLSWE